MAASDQEDVTRLLQAMRDGDTDAVELLAACVQRELHRIAVNALRRERPDLTLRPTELVDEAFVRLIGQRSASWQGRSQFYSVAARIIRRILVDHARHKRRAKRDHGVQVTLPEAVSDGGGDTLDLIALETALSNLEVLAPRQARVVELRFFAGLDVVEAADVLEISPATVKRDWTFARAFLLAELVEDG